MSQSESQLADELADEIDVEMSPIAMKIVNLGFALEGDDKSKIEQARNLYYAAGRIIRDVANRLREKEAARA